MISVSKSPTMVTLLNFGKKPFSKYSKPRFLTIAVRVRMPPASGITTKSATERSSVSQGIFTPPMPSKSATIGVNAMRMMRSFVATCTTV
ncbi:hypothetical protein SDC9_199559 [bioreactor metagenome]|uniref:Uncharacterized protein n=1 Tax=bioreactor metagenome TaxID=1076179 RepID=A0A645IKT4_9ZZZZ